jgi:hypothetical protein
MILAFFGQFESETDCPRSPHLIQQSSFYKASYCLLGGAETHVKIKKGQRLLPHGLKQLQPFYLRKMLCRVCTVRIFSARRLMNRFAFDYSSRAG